MKPLKMKTSIKWKEICELGEFLLRANEGRCMTIDELDGFFCALICGPEAVPPSEFLPEVFGQESDNDVVFATTDEANHYISLIMNLWNSIAHTLLNGKMYKPVIFDEDVGGIPSSARWASGFISGMQMRHEQWTPLMTSSDAEVLIAPVVMLAEQCEASGEIKPLPEHVLEMLLGNVMAALPVIWARNRGLTQKKKAGRKKSVSRKPRSKSGPPHVN